MQQLTEDFSLIEEVQTILRDFRIDRLHFGYNSRPEPFLPHFFRSCCSDAIASLPVGCQKEDCFSQRLRVPWSKEHSCAFVLQNLDWAADGRGSNSQPVQHALENDHTEGLIPTRNNEDV